MFLPQLSKTLTDATKAVLAGRRNNAKSSNYLLEEENLGAILTLINALTSAVLGMVRTVTSTSRPTRPLLRLLGHWDTARFSESLFEGIQKAGHS